MGSYRALGRAGAGRQRMIRWPCNSGAASRRRHGQPLRVLGLVLGGWVVLRLLIACLAVPAGADVMPPWPADRAALLAVRPAGGSLARGHHSDVAHTRRQGHARHGATMRPAVATPAENLLMVSAQVADFDRSHPTGRSWHAGLLALLDEDRMARLRD